MPATPVYEQMLDRDPRWALGEGSQFFEGKGAVQAALVKICSRMTSPSRLKDLADVLELIKILGLSPDFADQLDPYVRDRYRELWTASRDQPSDL